MYYVNYFSVKLGKKKRVGLFSLGHYSLTELSPESDEKLEGFKPVTAKITFACGPSANVLLRKLRDRLLFFFFFFLSDGGLSLLGQITGLVEDQSAVVIIKCRFIIGSFCKQRSF